MRLGFKNSPISTGTSLVTPLIRHWEKGNGAWKSQLWHHVIREKKIWNRGYFGVHTRRTRGENLFDRTLAIPYGTARQKNDNQSKMNTTLKERKNNILGLNIIENFGILASTGMAIHLNFKTQYLFQKPCIPFKKRPRKPRTGRRTAVTTSGKPPEIHRNRKPKALLKRQTGKNNTEKKHLHRAIWLKNQSWYNSGWERLGQGKKNSAIPIRARIFKSVG